MSITRDEIVIPDHEVLRKIGGGAYGEVWMARGVTGALRAVKIVWREDFEDERGFEREFEGILKFEPISRDHPGMVNILHVGRGTDEESPFYYYVMELGDDVREGRKIHPVEYEARTLRSDLKAGNGKPLEVEFCLDVARRLSAALEHLHGNDLAHRDVKPANVIFVDGKAKLADIGLVAARGQQTFVGTEGFVPPEGPGSGQADVYSLGKVLYEMATGKDRLQFPELPDELPTNMNRKQWLALNQVICSICEPKLSKRTINTAGDLREAVEKIQLGKKVREKRTVGLQKLMALLLVMGLGLAVYFLKPWRAAEPMVSFIPVQDQPVYKHVLCSVQFITTPQEARVFENDIEVDEETPTAFRQYPPGTKVVYRFEKEGYRPLRKEYIIPDREFKIFEEKLAIFIPPKKGQTWQDANGVSFKPIGKYHQSGLITESEFRKFLATKPTGLDAYSVELSKGVSLVCVTEETSKKYADWVEKSAKENGLLGNDQYVIALMEKDFKPDAPKAPKVEVLDPPVSPAAAPPIPPAPKKAVKRVLFPFYCAAKDIPYATVEINSDPVGARVFIDGVWAGVTPMSKELRPEKFEITLRKDGFKESREQIELADNEKRNHSAKLLPNNGVIMTKKWVNGMGVTMVPLGDRKMASAWEVRKKDYLLFTNTTGHPPFKDPLFPQKPNHPVVGVSKADAVAFCKWLTEKERKEDRLGVHHEYRLPTDKEWSLMTGLDIEKGDSPASRMHKSSLDPVLKNAYPWGVSFPPRNNVANLADQSAVKGKGVRKKKSINDYKDGFVNTAPVGSFAPNELGIFDLSGNVYEWVSDEYRIADENDDETQAWDVARGGSWATYRKQNLKSYYRFPTQKGFRDNLYGFRYILVDKDTE